MSQTFTIPKSALANCNAVTFETLSEGKRVNGLVTRVQNEYFAFQNLCKHLPITLDSGDGKVTCDDNTQLQCHMHGALYDFKTGECKAGPCVGARLNCFEVFLVGSRLVVRFPDKIKEL